MHFKRERERIAESFSNARIHSHSHTWRAAIHDGKIHSSILHGCFVVCVGNFGRTMNDQHSAEQPPHAGAVASVWVRVWLRARSKCSHECCVPAFNANQKRTRNIKRERERDAFDGHCLLARLECCWPMKGTGQTIPTSFVVSFENIEYYNYYFKRRDRNGNKKEESRQHVCNCSIVGQFHALYWRTVVELRERVMEIETTDLFRSFFFVSFVRSLFYFQFFFHSFIQFQVWFFSHFGRFRTESRVSSSCVIFAVTFRYACTLRLSWASMNGFFLHHNLFGRIAAMRILLLLLWMATEYYRQFSRKSNPSSVWCLTLNQWMNETE